MNEINNLGGHLVAKAKVGLSRADKQKMANDIYGDVHKYAEQEMDIMHSTIQGLGSLKPSGVAPSSTILAFNENKGVYVGSDSGYWYYFDEEQSKYVYGGVFVSNVNLVDLGTSNHPENTLEEEVESLHAVANGYLTDNEDKNTMFVSKFNGGIFFVQQDILNNQIYATYLKNGVIKNFYSKYDGSYHIEDISFDKKILAETIKRYRLNQLTSDFIKDIMYYFIRNKIIGTYLVDKYIVTNTYSTNGYKVMVHSIGTEILTYTSNEYQAENITSAYDIEYIDNRPSTTLPSINYTKLMGKFVLIQSTDNIYKEVIYYMIKNQMIGSYVVNDSMIASCKLITGNKYVVNIDTFDGNFYTSYQQGLTPSTLPVETSQLALIQIVGEATQKAINNIKNDLETWLHFELDDTNGELTLPDPMQNEEVVKRIQSIYVKSKGYTFTLQGYQDIHEVVKFNYLRVNEDGTLYIQVLTISLDDFSITIDEGRTISSGGVLTLMKPDSEIPTAYKSQTKLLSLSGIYVSSLMVSFSSPTLVETPVTSYIEYTFTRINDDGNLVVQKLNVNLEEYAVTISEAKTMASTNYVSSLITTALNSDY